MRRPNLPYLEFKTIKGRLYIYFRKGSSRHRLPNDPDSVEFSREYWRIRSGRREVTCNTTWNNLIVEFYKSPRFRDKAEGTKANYRRHCEEIRMKNGAKN
ncbi:integrase, partial [Rhodovulum sulfidophilum]|nr:integrase [Rhodovulum sulfidophilum]